MNMDVGTDTGTVFRRIFQYLQKTTKKRNTSRHIIGPQVIDMEWLAGLRPTGEAREDRGVERVADTCGRSGASEQRAGESLASPTPAFGVAAPITRRRALRSEGATEAGRIPRLRRGLSCHCLSCEGQPRAQYLATGVPVEHCFPPGTNFSSISFYLEHEHSLLFPKQSDFTASCSTHNYYHRGLHCCHFFIFVFLSFLYH